MMVLLEAAFAGCLHNCCFCVVFLEASFPQGPNAAPHAGRLWALPLHPFALSQVQDRFVTALPMDSRLISQFYYHHDTTDKAGITEIKTAP